MTASPWFDPARLPRPADPAAARRGLEQWCQQGGAPPGDAAEAALFDAVFGNSPFLTQALRLDPGFAAGLVAAGCEAAWAPLLDGLVRDLDAEDDTARLMAGLRRGKRRAALTVALADIAAAWPLERITAALSAFAEAALGLACRHLLRRAHRAGLMRLPDPARPETGSGLIVLAMGKFGALELNYSSDIDLIVFYDDDVAPVADPDERGRFFVRLARDLVRVMEERTADGYVFRTDLRLRPDPGATPLAVSVSAAEGYYGSLGQNWERAAMIKARVVAGDRAAGTAFLDSLRPFIWRRHLDFAAIQDIHAIKRQIHAHRGHHTAAVNGHDLKLGRGGIREIEFFAQTQQLIFGGRDQRLRVSGTIAALDALADAGRIPAAVATDLADCYRFLRRAEHRLQMVDDRQTHTLPTEDAGVAAIAGFLGYDAAADFRRDLLDVLGRVEDHYAALFEEAPPLSGAGNLVFTGPVDDPGTLGTLAAMGFANPAGVAATVRGWHHGRYRATRSVRARELLTELLPALLQALAGTRQPDAAFGRFDHFLGLLPAGVPVFALFHANPGLLGLIAEIMGAAPALAEALARRPGQLEAVLTPGFTGPLPDRDALAVELQRQLALSQGYEDTLSLVRRWSGDLRFQAGVHVLRHLSAPEAVGRFLSDAADLALAALLPEVEAEFARRHGGFGGPCLAVLALGKLGSRQMSFRSDLDLIMVYDVPPDRSQSDGPKPLSPGDYHARLTQRLIAAITAPTAEGPLFEVDMRLRPSGNAGPLAVSLDGFTAYQADRAWTWEHLALTRARVVAGPSGLARRLDQAVRVVLTRPRDPVTLLRDVAEMRGRIDREFGTASLWDVKYVRGGTIDAEFIAQTLMLRHGHDHPDVLATDSLTALTRLAGAGLLDPEAAADLIGALRLWFAVQGFLRLAAGAGFDADQAPPGLKAGLMTAVLGAEAAAFDFPGFERHLRAVAAVVHGHFTALIEAPASRVEETA